MCSVSTLCGCNRIERTGHLEVDSFYAAMSFGTAIEMKIFASVVLSYLHSTGAVLRLCCDIIRNGMFLALLRLDTRIS